MTDIAAPWPPTITYRVARAGQDQVPGYDRDFDHAIQFADYRRTFERLPAGVVVIVEAVTTYRVLDDEELAARVPKPRTKKAVKT